MRREKISPYYDSVNETKLSAHSFGRHLLLIILVWCIGAVCSYQVYRYEAKNIHRDNSNRFNKLKVKLESEIKRRVNLLGYGLKGTRSAFVVNPTLKERDFTELYRSREVEKEFPGALGLGFITYVPREDYPKFISAQKSSNRDHFTVKTTGAAPNLYVITFIEPREMNEAALGFDVGQEIERRQAADRAAESGEIALTAPISLVQASDNGPGFLILLPVYSQAEIPSTVAQRWSSLRGWTYMPILARKLFEGLGDVVDHELDFEVFEGLFQSTDKLIFHNQSELEGANSSKPPIRSEGYSEITQIPVGGRTWTISSRASQHFQYKSEEIAYWWAGAAFLVSSLTLTYLFHKEKQLSHTRKIVEHQNLNLEVYSDVLANHTLLSRTDKNGVITQVNKHFCDVSGYDELELIGSSHTMLHSGVDAREFWKELWNRLSLGEMWQGELCNKKKDGSLYWVASTIAPLRESNREIGGFLNVGTDITQLKSSEANLALSVKKATEATKAKSEFLANMSHEIRTPMNGVIGMTDLLLETHLSKEQHEYVEALQSSGENLLSIINDILDFSKIEAGKISLEPVPTSIRSIIKGLGFTFEKVIRDKSVSFIVDVSPELPETILIDPLRVRQVLTNLIGNAFKFTQSGGAIVVYAHSVTQDSQGGVLQCAVLDSGIGISESKQAKIFDVFSQAESSTARLYGGTGLGLSISQSLVKMMGGELRVCSEEGVGSRFYFDLPYELAESKELTEHTSAVSKLRGDGKRALVAEDNLVNQKITRTILEKFGFNVTVVADGFAAVEAAFASSFDIILMDLQMPGMDGEEATKLIKEHEFVGGVCAPIIALTASAMAGDRERCLDMGMDDYVTKPIRRNELEAALARCLL